jgi:hypothetical protein
MKNGLTVCQCGKQMKLHLLEISQKIFEIYRSAKVPGLEMFPIHNPTSWKPRRKWDAIIPAFVWILGIFWIFYSLYSALK